VYDHVSHLQTAHEVWLKLCNTYEGSSEIKSSHKDTYNRQYQTFSQKPGEYLDDYFARFESIVSSLRSCGPLAYFDNERTKQLLYALYDHVWGMKITALDESADFTTLDIEKLFSKLKSHELSCKGRPNHDASLTSKALITCARVDDHDANPTNTNTISSFLEFPFHPLLQLPANSTRASPTMRLPCWQESYVPCTNSARRGGGHLGAASSAAAPPTSSPTAPRGRSSTSPISTTTPIRMTPPTRVTTRSTALETRRRRRSSRRSCPECVLP
jgi:hypothetical protein